MKIIKLTASNIKRLTSVEITPQGNVVKITGKNSAGKTSVLDAIWWALAGAHHIQKSPIHDDQDEGRIQLDMGELIVTRTFKRKEDDKYTTSIVVENAEGARFQTPQRMLDELLGALTFDPLEFTRMDARKQFDLLKTFVTDFDFEANAAKRQGLYDQRTELNRAARMYQDQAKGIDLPEVLPQPMDMDAIQGKYNDACQHNANIGTRKQNRIAMQENIASRQLTIEGLREQIKGMQEEMDRLIADNAHDESRIKNAPPLPEPVPTDPILVELKEAQRVDKIYAAIDQREQLRSKADEKEQTSAELSLQIEQLDKEKESAIRAAKLPVAGIGFGDNSILFNELPFDQASSAEQLRVSLGMAMALNPKIRVLRVTDASLLDSDSMQIIEEMVNANDYQIWLEVVDESGQVGIVIEDGKVKVK